MTEQLDDRVTDAEAHPPFRMRPRRRLLLPDLSPPTRAELRWAAEQRRIRRAQRRSGGALVPEPDEADIRSRPMAEELVPEPAADLDWLDDAHFEPTPEADQDAPEAEPDTPEGEPDAPEEAADSPDEQEAPPAPQVPVALEPVEQAPIPTFSRLRSPRLVVPDPEWFSRGPLIEDPDDIDVPDLEPALDLDFHPTPVASPRRQEEDPAEPVEVVVVDLTPWRPPTDELALSDDEPAEPDDEPAEPDGELPVVSHLLVVRDPAGTGQTRIAVLDDAAAEPAEDTLVLPRQADRRLDHRDLPPVEVADDSDPADVLAYRALPVTMPATLAPDIEQRYEYEAAPAVPKMWDGRPAPMYWRVLRLRHVRPNGWLRALFFEGSVAIAVVLVLAEAASVWTIVVLPMVVAIIVKANDVLVGSLRRSFAAPGAVAPERDR